MKAFTQPLHSDNEWTLIKGSNLASLGPNLPWTLTHHSMVPLSHGQVILGGLHGENYENIVEDRIHFLTCSNIMCSISPLIKKLSIPRQRFIAIPIPDTISECISGGKILMILTF